MKRLKAFVIQFMMFAGVGIVAFVIDYGLLIVFTELFGIHYIVSTSLAFTASVIFNYLASMRFVFTHRTDISRRREFIIFVVLSIIGLLLTNLGMYLGVDVCGIDYRITKILATMCVTVFNFITRRIFLDGARRSNGSEDGNNLPRANGGAFCRDGKDPLALPTRDEDVARVALIGERGPVDLEREGDLVETPRFSK